MLFEKSICPSDIYLNFVTGPGWKCQFCPPNQTNPNPESSNECTPCTGAHNVDDGQRLKCVDPYTCQYVVFTGIELYITITLTVLGSTLAIMILSIFIIYRETMTVKVADTHISFFHLIITSLTICSTCALYIIPLKTTAICIQRNLVLTILYSSNVGLVFTKSQKILNAFLSTVRVNTNEIKRTLAVQIFTIIMFVLISNVVLLVIYLIKPPGVDFILNNGEKERLYFCNSSHHTNLLFIVYQMLCLIQAFRGRHLPGPMNNAMSLVYGTMITTMIFAISFPITYFRDVFERDFIHCVMVLFNCIVILLFLYGKPCFIIIFKPDKNTKGYFNQKRLAEMSLRAGFKSQ